MARGLTNQEIGRVLGIAEGTVKAHLAAIFQALDVDNRTEAAMVLRELES
jgi:DNA-binding NarL/FixJ family response regulator